MEYVFCVLFKNTQAWALPQTNWILSPGLIVFCSLLSFSLTYHNAFKFIYAIVFCSPFFFKNFICLFIYLFLAVLGLVALLLHGLSLVAESWGYSSLPSMGFSLRWLLLLWSTGSRRAGFRGCDARAQLLCSMWDLPGPGLKSVSPALAGRFLTTAPPGKSLLFPFIPEQLYHILSILITI